MKQVHRRGRLLAVSAFVITCLALTATIFISQPAQAATPSSGTISSTSPNLTWCGSTGCSALITASASTSPLSSDCSNSTCDVYTLTVGSVPANMLVAVKITWTNPANDFDLHVVDANGIEVCSSTGGAPSTAEACTFPAVAGTYTVKALEWTVVADNFVGTAQLQTAPQPSTPSYTTGGFTFSPNVTLKAPATNRDGEPSNRTDYLGNAYVGAIRGFPAGVDLWKFDLNPLSATFDPNLRNPAYQGQPDGFPTNGLFDVGADGGGDIDLAVGFQPPAVGNGLPTLAEVSLIAANISASKSTDLGNTWTLDPAGSYIPADDRQWIEFYKGDYVFMMYRAPIPATPLYVATSIDGGLTYPVTSLVSTGGTTPGYISVDQNTGWIYVGHLSSSALFVSRAKFDATNPLAPLSFQTVTVDNTTPHGHLFDAVKVGRDGTVYAVWSDDHNIFYSYSTDHGATWSVKTQVSNPTFAIADRNGVTQTVKTNIFPWLEAGTAGRVDFVWFATTEATNNDNADWVVMFSQATNANTSTPVFRQVVASDHFIHAGNVSEMGLGGAANRNLLDYFQVSLDPQGGAMIAFADDHNDFTGHTYVTRQISGPSAYSGANGTGYVTTVTPAPAPAQDPTKPQVVDFRDDTVAETAVVPGDNAWDITSIRYGCQQALDGSTLLTAAMNVSSLATVPAEANWRVNFSANSVAGLGDRADQFFLQASTETSTPTFFWGTTTRNSDGSFTYTTRAATDVGYFDTVNNQVVFKVNLNQLNAFASKPLGIGSTLIGLRGSTYEIPITVNNVPAVGSATVSAPRDVTRGGSIPLGAMVNGDTFAGIGTASYTIANCAGASVQPPPPPPPGTKKVASESGDGTVPAGASTGKFHFDVDNSPGGQLTYSDKGAGIELESTAITSFTPPNGDQCVSFSGNARVNDEANHIFTVKACDNDNNGKSDTFTIHIDANYSATGTLKTGNINIHEK